MANRRNHYEAALEDYLRAERVPYVAVDEKRRALSRHGSLKSVDFILSPEPADQWPADHWPITRWLVDVKGRRFPSGTRRKQYWRNWATAEEVRSLSHWARRFGPEFGGLLVFAYHLVADRSPTAPEQVHYWRGEPYAFVGVPIDAYRAAARTLSRSWDTVSVPAAQFRRLARPLSEFLGGEFICQEPEPQSTLVE